MRWTPRPPASVCTDPSRPDPSGRDEYPHPAKNHEPLPSLPHTQRASSDEQPTAGTGLPSMRKLKDPFPPRPSSRTRLPLQVPWLAHSPPYTPETGDSSPSNPTPADPSVAWSWLRESVRRRPHDVFPRALTTREPCPGRSARDSSRASRPAEISGGRLVLSPLPIRPDESNGRPGDRPRQESGGKSGIQRHCQREPSGGSRAYSTSGRRRAGRVDGAPGSTDSSSGRSSGDTRGGAGECGAGGLRR